MADKKTPIVILFTFFGCKPGQDKQKFTAEIKALSPAEKKELVELAAKELGVEVDWPQSA
jgi:hypothetical protein